jgi:hypothetical protein
VAGTPRMARPAVENAWRIAAGVVLAITALCFVDMFLFLTAQTQ